MRMRATFSVLLFTGFLCFRSIAFSQEVHVSLVDRAPEDVNFRVLGMTQDPDGYLWLATETGLYKYDGHQYVAYHSQPLDPNSPASFYIECIAADRDGLIWFGPALTGMDRLDPKTGIFTHFRHNNHDPGSLANDTVAVILQDHEGIMWIGTAGGLDRFDPKTNHFFHYQNKAGDVTSLSFNSVRSIYEDRQGTIWVGTWDATNGKAGANEGGLNKLNRNTGKFTRYMHDEKNPHSLIDNSVRAMFEDSRGVFWVGTAGDGLHTMDRATGNFERHPYDPLHPDRLSRPPLRKDINFGTDHITFITEDAWKRIWIGTFEGGINIYDPSTGKVSFVGRDTSREGKVKDNHFWSGFKTRDNIIWLGAWESNFYKVIPYQNKLDYIKTGDVCFDFAEDDSQTLWKGGYNSLTHVGKDGKQEKFLFDKSTPPPYNLAISIEKEDGKFWVSSFQGLCYFDPVSKLVTKYPHLPGNTNSPSSDLIDALLLADDHQLWIGENKGLDLMNTKTGNWKHFSNKPDDTTSLSNNEVNMLGMDKSKNLWIGTNGGLNRYNKQDGHFKRYLNKTSVFSIFQDKSGRLWIGTVNGLFTYNEDTDQFSPFTDEASILTATFVSAITEDRSDNLWFSTVKGIVKLNKERTDVALYGFQQGVNALALTPFSYLRKNGELVFGDTLGFFQFQPAVLLQNVSAPGVTIGNFLLNNVPVRPSPGGILEQPLTETKIIRLQHDQNTLSFEYEGIDLGSDHAEMNLLYMLQNYDNGWRKSGGDKKAYYFNLPPGKYIFKVKAINDAGLTSEKDIDILISPPWWSNWWAYSIFALLAAGMIWGFIAYRSRTLIRENKILEEKVDRRTTELNNSLENLKAAQTQLIQSEKMASLGELTAGIAHEIQNPLNFVNNFSEVNTELIEEAGKEIELGNMDEVKSLFGSIKENEQKINHHGKRADSIVKSMLQHSRRSSGVKEKTDINALADEYLKLSYQGVRAKDKSFNTALVADYDQTIPEINIVAQDIARVLVNLYNNAFYAVSEKSMLGLTDYEPRVSVLTRQSGGNIEIHIHDNGKGISQQVIEKIFQPFFTTKPAGQGTGLGLSLSYDIIRAHGGELKIETKEGEWAEFVVVIPIG